MKKYLPPLVLLAANNEIATLVALIIISLIFLSDMINWFSEREW